MDRGGGGACDFDRGSLSVHDRGRTIGAGLLLESFPAVDDEVVQLDVGLLRTDHDLARIDERLHV